MLSRELQIRVTDAVMPGKRIRAAKRLLLGTNVATDLLFAPIVNRILVSCQVVGPREDGVARLASAGVDAFAFVRPSLRIEEVARCCGRNLWPAQTSQTMRLSMTLALVLLQQRWCLESLRAPVICAGVSATLSANVLRSLWARSIGRW